MSPTIDEEWKRLYTCNSKIQAFAVCKPSEVIWMTSNWNIVPDLNNILNAPENNSPSVSVGGVDYYRVDSTPDSYVASSENNQGHLLIYLIELKTWAVAWAASDSIPELAITDLAMTATKLKGSV
ncbi:MAG: hypothetical protein PVG65_03790 [Candidatus Thorarchaeota archaeon]|jgi:hypothetical protein